MAAGNPPDTFQNNAGWTLLKWVVYNGRDEADSKLEPLDFIVQQNKLTTHIPALVLDTVSYTVRSTAFPSTFTATIASISTRNSSTPTVCTAPTTLAEFYTVAEAFKAKGITPLAIGSKDGHAVKTHTWDGLIVSKASAEFRTRI